MRTPMRINDKFDVIATLDSGNPANVLFSRDLISHNGMSFLEQEQFLVEGVSGQEVESCGHLTTLALGPVRYQNPAACASPSFARNEILVGLDFMHAFNYVFDYPDGIVVMFRRAAY
ncbi:MAG TPA: aspartyl protease family protein, partial [Candidatus Elarobacter sp.]|nr:aspartyl protease family protein [Candidatus Elarobacter sp.]